ncbi:hypothetical protein HOE04_04655 [archaeon]|nr:hypothetical protein [archaeon]
MMLGLGKRVFGLGKNIPLGGVIEGDSIVGYFGEERVLKIDYNRGKKVVLISRVQTDPEGIVKRTIGLNIYYPTSLNANKIEVIYKGQKDYDKCEEILGELK